MSVLGLDISTSCCGWAIVSRYNKKFVLGNYGKIIVPGDLNHLQKYNYIIKELGDVYEKFRDDIDNVAIEQPNSFRNGAITRLLCGLYGVVRLHFLNKYNIELIEINTKEAKKSFTGNGNADKLEVIKMANKKYKIKLQYHKTNKNISDEDTADALAITETCVMKLMEK